MSTHMLFCSNSYFFLNFSLMAVLNVTKSLMVCLSQYVTPESETGNGILGISEQTDNENMR